MARAANTTPASDPKEAERLALRRLEGEISDVERLASITDQLCEDALGHHSDWVKAVIPNGYAKVLLTEDQASNLLFMTCETLARCRALTEKFHAAIEGAP